MSVFYENCRGFESLQNMEIVKKRLIRYNLIV